MLKPESELTSEDVNRLYFDLDEGKFWAVVETFHCAGGVDEHTYACKFNHWTEYRYHVIDLEVAKPMMANPPEFTTLGEFNGI